MRPKITFALLLLTLSVFAQNQYRQILLTNPFRSNGYFIVDETVRQQIGATRLNVDVIVNTDQGNGTYVRNTVQTFSIAPPLFYAQADLSLVGPLGTGEYVIYHLTATKPNGTVVVDYEDCDGCAGLCAGCTALPEVCRSTCDAPSYGWSLIAYSGQAQTVIEIGGASDNGLYLYFYVKGTDWAQFTTQFSTTDFGVPGYWSQYPWIGPDALAHQEVKHLSSVPPEARDYQGYSLGQYSGGCYAVYKDKGPWRNFYAETNTLIGGSGEYCLDGADGLEAVYNGNGSVQQQMLQTGTPPLACAGYLSEGGGLTWGADAGYEQDIEVDANGNTDVINYLVEVVDCPDELATSLDELSSLTVDHIDPINGGTVFTVGLPDENDPKLVPVKRTVLVPGLYEFTIVYDNGTMLRHYQDFPNGTVISATFAQFTQVNVYPVPVTGRTFAVDFDLLAPMDIDLSIVNNNGTVYYSKALSFEVAGRNKHVVNMTTPWPSGIYHCILQYEDGSSESVNITVD